MRVSRLLKNSVNIGVALVFFMFIYYTTRDEADSAKYLKVAYESPVVQRDQVQAPGYQVGPPIPKQQQQKQRKQNQEDVVVVVVAAAPPADHAYEGLVNDVMYANENVGVESLEAPAKPPDRNVEDREMLRDNDVMIGDVVFDRSEELSIENALRDNDTLYDNEFDDVLHLGEAARFEAEYSHSSAYYSPAELLPALSKPPSDRNAPGEFGHPFHIPHKVAVGLRSVIAQGYMLHGFNTIVADILSIHRNLGDRREQQCKDKLYLKPLPTVSVIVCFHNEHISILRRTLYSILETVPAILLSEVILVDDGSGLAYLMEPLQREVADLGTLVNLIRTPKQIGVIKARLLGMKEAKGEVIAFLDSHCECYEGWIEPLLDRIRTDRTVIATPIIEIIDRETFEFSVTPMQMVQRGGFDWTLTYRWIAPPRERFEDPTMDMSVPITTPAISGGVFCVDKKFFEEMGSYDDGMDTWGSENLEISFRMWMCGGRLEIIPCSHVGHVFRTRTPPNVNLEIVLKNKRRVADVWLDDYEEVFFKKLPFAQTVEAGNITEREELRSHLQCKPYQWYLENIYPDLYIPEINPLHTGAICCRFGDSSDFCLDTHTADAIPGRIVCVDGYQKSLVTQQFEYTKQDELRQSGPRDICLGAKGNKVEIQRCGYPAEDPEMAPDAQRWEVGENGTILNIGNALCLTASASRVWLDKCDPSNKIRQTWKWR